MYRAQDATPTDSDTRLHMRHRLSWASNCWRCCVSRITWYWLPALDVALRLVDQKEDDRDGDERGRGHFAVPLEHAAERVVLADADGDGRAPMHAARPLRVRVCATGLM